jgi:hypothetical protein
MAEPTVGCRQYADRLAERGYGIAKSTVQQLEVRHGLGRRAQRVARAAALSQLVGGPSRRQPPATTCSVLPMGATDAPTTWQLLDSFYIGDLKSVGRVYQLTAVGTAAGWALVMLVVGVHDGAVTARILAEVLRRHRRMVLALRAVLTDNGPESIAKAFTALRMARRREAHGKSQVEELPGKGLGTQEPCVRVVRGSGAPARPTICGRHSARVFAGWQTSRRRSCKFDSTS